jgi:hypothetical protein
MESPFPGMDPFIEASPYWRDFHDRLVSRIGESLEERLSDKYAAFVNERLYVVEHERPVYPDVAVLESRSPRGGGAAVMVPARQPEPIVVELVEEEIREPYIVIVEPRAGNRLVTAIEVLSPEDKAPGPGRESYLQKRDEFWRSGAHLVEIDLLREGQTSAPRCRRRAGLSRALALHCRSLAATALRIVPP